MTGSDTCKQSLTANENGSPDILSGQLPDITAVILAGGQARRMGGEDKALISLDNRYLILHSLEKLSTQVDAILVNANRNHKQYEALGYPVISDQIEGFAGPLAGIASALQAIETDLLLVTPCDSPFIPEDMAARLSKAMLDKNTQIAVAHDGKRLQPVFALINKQVLPSLLDYLAAGQHKIDTWYEQQNMATADFSDIPDTFININTPEELQSAELHLTRQKIGLPVIGFAAHSGSGKTTLLKQLIPLLNKKKIRLGLVKHAHHNFDVDVPGKDSYELRKAGASQVLVGSSNRWALMAETPDVEDKPALSELLKHLDHENLDLILVEGFKLENIPKIEVFRPGLGKPRLSINEKSYIAVATDVPSSHLKPPTHLPVLDLNNIDSIAEFILQQIEPDQIQA